MVNKYLIISKALIKLGFLNLLRVLIYRIQIKFGYFVFFTPKRLFKNKILFKSDKLNPIKLPEHLSEEYVKSADYLLSGFFPIFFHTPIFVGSPPRWYQSFEPCPGGHWSKIPINQTIEDDIKRTWDLSRFHWMPTFAAAYSTTKNDIYLEAINTWFDDWIRCNPINTGLNWICAQEVSIRLLNILNTNWLLGARQVDVSDSMLSIVFEHCKRIYPTTGYSVAQDNNHCISEAAALLVGGEWILVHASDKIQADFGRTCSKKGRKLLERALSRLVLHDGGFSMGSFAYHRVVLDTLSIVEFWLDYLALPKFSNCYYKAAKKMVDFLYQICDSDSGDVPNVGANDGSRSYLLTTSDYRDFRPSLQLASGYFSDQLIYNCERINWYSASLPSEVISLVKQVSKIYMDSGFATLRSDAHRSWALVRFPVYLFRPMQSDSLHFDLWWKGRNILRDSGSYGYNCNEIDDSYFTGARGHNVVQFDDRESMPRIRKFLWGEWLKLSHVSKETEWLVDNFWQSEFKDYLGAKHSRKIFLNSNTWRIIDNLSGYKTATLRWHIEGNDWNLIGNEVVSSDVKIVINSDGEFKVKLSSGWNSKYYSHRICTTVIEIDVLTCPINLVTEVNLACNI